MSIEEVIKLLNEDIIKLIEDSINIDNQGMLEDLISNNVNLEFAIIHYSNYYSQKNHPDSEIVSNIIMKSLKKDKTYYKRLMRWVTKEN